MIQIFDNILTETELIELDFICENFYAHIQPVVLPDGNFSSYYRNRININTTLIDFQKRILKKIDEVLFLQTNVIDMSINKITTETNKNDKFHKDISDLSVVIFLNDNIIGGEFVYEIDGKIYNIKPKKNTGIIMNNKLSHKVFPVHKGIRYTFITFLDVVKKDKKTLI
jgi:hypothetical protein